MQGGGVVKGPIEVFRPAPPGAPILGQGRPRVPSFYTLELMRAAEGRLPGFAELARRAACEQASRLGWPAPENEGVVRMGDWNDYLVEVVGNRYRSRLNGVQMVDFTDPKPSSIDGKIALQLHAGGKGNMEFKDVWIRDLSAR